MVCTRRHISHAGQQGDVDLIIHPSEVQGFTQAIQCAINPVAELNLQSPNDLPKSLLQNIHLHAIPSHTHTNTITNKTHNHKDKEKDEDKTKHNKTAQIQTQKHYKDIHIHKHIQKH